MELNLYAAAVDLLLLAIFGVTVWRGWRRGLVSAAAGLLSLVGALIISGMFSYLFYGILQRTIFDPFVFDIDIKHFGDPDSRVFQPFIVILLGFDFVTEGVVIARLVVYLL